MRRLIVLLAAGLFTLTAHAGRVDYNPDRDYVVTDRHGPWMIMVATLHKPGVDRPDDLEKNREDESVAREAAKKLVLDLRAKNIPAYVFELKKSRQSVETVDRLGRRQTRRTLADDAQISVLAGNYESVNSETAVKTLRWIKKFNPPSFGDKAIYQRVGDNGPLAGAFLTVNPLLSAEEVRRRTVDPEYVKLMRYLNAGNAFSLADCGGQYTLRVKTFRGNSSVKAARKDSGRTIAVNDGLNRAGRDATLLCESLRKRGVEAYLWHDRYESYVSVGAFSSPTDPGVAALTKRYSPEQAYNPKTQVVETIYKTEPPNRGRVLEQGHLNGTWFFDAEPTVVRVPRMPRSKR